MQESLPQQVPPQEAPSGLTTPLSKRAWLSLLCLVVVTVVALALAWCWPDNTSWHFAWVAQAVPLCYAFLMWWGCTDLQEPVDGD